MANWIQKVKSNMQKKGTTGSFSRAARSAGESTQEFANKELKSKTSSTKMKRRASLAKTFAKLRKK